MSSKGLMRGGNNDTHEEDGAKKTAGYTYYG